jgi:hypothetical protein
MTDHIENLKKKLKMSDRDILYVQTILDKYSSGPMKSLNENADPITLEWMREFSDRSFGIMKKLDEMIKALDDLDAVKFAVCESDAALVTEAKQLVKDAVAKLDSMKILEAAPFPNLGPVIGKMSLNAVDLEKMSPEKIGAHLIELGKRIDQAYASDVIDSLPFWERVSTKFKQLLSSRK